MKISRKKHIIILILIGIVYFIGVAAIVYPIIGDAYMTNSSKTTIQSFVSNVKNMTENEIDERLKTAQEYNDGVKYQIYDKEKSKALNASDGLMCYVEMPRLDIYLPVFYGTSTEVLLKGCGWLENTSLPVGGSSTHASVSGHTGLPNAEMFTKLDHAVIGDLFYIHTLDMVLAYQVDNINTVTPNDTKHLLVEPGKDYVTLLTCTPYGINDKRLLVRGVRIFPEEEQASDDAPSEKKVVKDAQRADDGLQSKIDHDMRMILIIVVIAVIVFVAACIWLGIILRRRPKHLSGNTSEEQHEKAEK